MSRRYEMVLVADPTVPEPSHDEHITRIESLIGELGGVVQKVDRWGRQKLAYSIARHNEGNYTLVLFDGAPDVEKELLRRLRLSDTFIRFLSVRADHEKPPTVEEREALAEARQEHLRRAAERDAETEARAARKEEGGQPEEAIEAAEDAQAHEPPAEAPDEAPAEPEAAESEEGPAKEDS